MDIVPETLHMVFDATKDKEIHELEEQNKRLREMIEKTKEALNYFPKDNGQGTSKGCAGESSTTHLRTGEDTARDKGLPESK